MAKSYINHHLIFFIVGIFQFIGMLIAEVDYKIYNPDKLTSVQHLMISFFGLLGTFVLLWLFMKYVDKEKFINLGFSIKNRLKDFNVGLILGAVIMIIGYLLHSISIRNWFANLQN